MKCFKCQEFMELCYWWFVKLFALFLFRWEKLLSDSNQRRQRLLRAQEQYREVEDLFLLFAKKASAFNSWFENAEEDLTDPVRCNSVEEIRVSHSPFLGSLSWLVMLFSNKYQVSACTPKSLGHKYWWRPELYWVFWCATLFLTWNFCCSGVWIGKG